MKAPPIALTLVLTLTGRMLWAAETNGTQTAGANVRAEGAAAFVEAVQAVRDQMARPHPGNRMDVLDVPAEAPDLPDGPTPSHPHPGNTRAPVFKLSREEVAQRRLERRIRQLQADLRALQEAAKEEP